ncbi:MFS transporter [Clostridium coskatii]|uniref:Major facilitator superfamily protein n=1 Tax=Clostridium coskatii TaxID=1705578 RepID=A0A166TP23_9CLOT|nr:MFS transporter [Clostridium coskatii]OAA93924.1 Major Facilitator Superfamily protein [Clostridium coskatii]OBR95253.1 major facilitator superfamily protein [Clostridium coskatii]
MENVSGKKSLWIFAILSFGFLIMATGTTSPALANISQAYPNLPFSVVVLIATIPTLLLIPFSLISGKLAGTVITYKNLTIIAIVLFLIGGVGPYFISNFSLILVMRGILGAGLGIMSPLGGALTLTLFEPKEAENLMGAGVVVGNVGGIVFQLLGGIFCAVNWRFTFLAYLLGAVSLIIVILFFPKLPLTAKSNSEKVKMPAYVYIWSSIYGILMLLVYPMLTGMSSLVLTNHYGNAAGAGVALTMFTVGGMIAGAVFGAAFRMLSRFTIPIGVVLTAVGFIFFAYGTNLILFIIGATIVGIGFSLSGTAIMMQVGRAVPASGTAVAMSIVMAFMSIGGFVSGFVFAFIEKIFNITSLRFPFEFSLVCFIIYAVIHLVVNFKTPKKQKVSI